MVVIKKGLYIYSNFFTSDPSFCVNTNNVGNLVNQCYDIFIHGSLETLMSVWIKVPVKCRECKIIWTICTFVIRKYLSTDHSKPLIIPAGMDSLSQIGKCLQHHLLFTEARDHCINDIPRIKGLNCSTNIHVYLNWSFWIFNSNTEAYTVCIIISNSSDSGTVDVDLGTLHAKTPLDLWKKVFERFFPPEVSQHTDRRFKHKRTGTF